MEWVHQIMAFIEKHGRWALLFGVMLLSGVVLLGQATLFAKWAATALLILAVPAMVKEVGPPIRA